MNTETTAIETTPVETVTPEVATTTEAQPIVASSEAPIVDSTVTAEPVPYTPVAKYKYMSKEGKKIESELPPEIKSLIKSKEDEEKWSKLYSKAEGLEFIQSERDNVRTQFKKYQEDLAPVIDVVTKANKAIQSNDLDSLFEIVGIRPEAIEQYVFNRLKMQEMPPEQRQIIEQNKALQKQHQMVQERMSLSEQKNLQIQSEMLSNELYNELSRPEVTSFKELFDSKNGEGAFENEIRARGEAIYHTQNGRIARPSEVVKEVLNKYSFAIPGQTQMPSASVQQPQVVKAQAEKPTIPVISGSGGSPTRQSFKTATDLENYYNEKFST